MCFITGCQCQLPLFFSCVSWWTPSPPLKATFCHTANLLMRLFLWRKMAARNALCFKPPSAAGTASPRWIYILLILLILQISSEYEKWFTNKCFLQEPVYKSPFSSIYQHVCTYRDVRYETVRLPDCRPGVDPHVTYPVALSCECSLCTMDTSDCTIESLNPDFCMTQKEYILDYWTSANVHAEVSV